MKKEDYVYEYYTVTSARLALLAGRQAAQAAFWALVRRNGVSTYYLAHTESPWPSTPTYSFPHTESHRPGTPTWPRGTQCERENRLGRMVYGTQCERKSRLGHPPWELSVRGRVGWGTWLQGTQPERESRLGHLAARDSA